MRLFLKWLKPATIPSKRKNTPFRLRLQNTVYCSCLNVLRHYYLRYAYSDNITISDLRIHHEFRDLFFEQELKKFGLAINESLIDVHGSTSESRRSFRYSPFLKSFDFCDSLQVEYSGERIEVSHGVRHAFYSSLKGNLKVSVPPAIAAYCYSRVIKKQKAVALDPYKLTREMEHRPECKKVNGLIIDESF